MFRQNEGEPFGFSDRSHWKQGCEIGALRNNTVGVGSCMEHRLHGAEQDSKVGDGFAHETPNE